MKPAKIPDDLKDKVNPQPLEELTEGKAEKGCKYLCMVCGEEYEEGKKAKGHACQQNHRKWIRHTKMPSGWDNPYKLLVNSTA